MFRKEKTMLEQAFHLFYSNSLYALGALVVSLAVSYILKYQVIPNIDSTSMSGWRNKVVADNFKRIFNLFAIFLVVLAVLRIIVTIGTFFAWLITSGSLAAVIGAIVVAFIFLSLLAGLFSLASPLTILLFFWL